MLASQRDSQEAKEVFSPASPNAIYESSNGETGFSIGAAQEFGAAEEHGGACVWVGPLAEYKEHMHKCVDGAAAFIKARIEPVPMKFLAPVAMEPSKEISKPRVSDQQVMQNAGTNPEKKAVEPRMDPPPERKSSIPSKQASSGKDPSKHSKQKEGEQGRKETCEGAKPPAKVVLCRHFERLGTCRLGSKRLGHRPFAVCSSFFQLCKARVKACQRGVPSPTARRSWCLANLRKGYARPCFAGILSRATAGSPEG